MLTCRYERHFTMNVLQLQLSKTLFSSSLLWTEKFLRSLCISHFSVMWQRCHMATATWGRKSLFWLMSQDEWTGIHHGTLAQQQEAGMATRTENWELTSLTASMKQREYTRSSLRILPCNNVFPLAMLHHLNLTK